jgi:hypothetical protein
MHSMPLPIIDSRIAWTDYMSETTGGHRWLNRQACFPRKDASSVRDDQLGVPIQYPRVQAAGSSEIGYSITDVASSTSSTTGSIGTVGPATSHSSHPSSPFSPEAGTLKVIARMESFLDPTLEMLISRKGPGVAVAQTMKALKRDLRGTRCVSLSPRAVLR